MSQKNMRPKIFIWQGYWEGGAERITLGIAEAFRKYYGIDPTLGVFEKSDSVDFEQILVKKLFPRRFMGYNNLWASLYLNKKGVLDNFDIVFTHGAGFWKTRKNFYVYHEAADLDELFKHLPLRSKLLYWLPHKISIHSLKKADLVVSASRKCDTFLRKHGIINFIKSNTFVDTELFRPLGRRKEQKEFKVLFVGRPDPVKNFDNLRKACERIEGLKLLVAGIEGESSENVRYFGWVGKKELSMLYNQADLFVLPSYYEGFSMSALEALACGTHVLISQPACPSEIEDFVIKCKTDSHDICDKIRFIIKNYDEIRKTTTKGQEFVEKNFEKNKVLEKETQEILSCYESKRGKA